MIVTLRTAIAVTGSSPMRPPIEGLDSTPLRRLDRAPRPARLPEAPRRPRRRDHRLRVRASIFARFGSEVTIIEMLPSLIPQEDEDAAKELAKQFGKRNIALHLEKQCTKVEDSGSALTVHFGEGETETDLMLVSVGRAPQVENLGLEELGVELDRRKGIAADEHRRTTVEHIYAVGDCAGYWQLAHCLPRRRGRRGGTRRVTRLWSTTAPSPARSATDPEIAGVAHGAGGPRAVRRRCRGRDVPAGRERPRRGERDDRMGQVDPRGAGTASFGLVMVGPHVTDLIEAGVVAIDEATVETVADGMAAHPTLSEAIKEAGLVALGRAIHLPNRKPDGSSAGPSPDSRERERRRGRGTAISNAAPTRTVSSPTTSARVRRAPDRSA